MRPATTLSLILLAACTTTGETAPPSDLAASVRVFKAGTEITLDRLWSELAAADCVFFGETHLDETTHRLELAAYEELTARSGRQVVLAMEMFERDVQPVLDDYLAGEIPERDFLASARPWGNYRTGYRALIEAAKQRQLPVVASNAPAALRRTISRGGAEALAGLSEEDRRHFPPEILENDVAYWRRFRRVLRGHGGPPAGDPDPAAMLYNGQSLWDNCMGWSCAEALDARPGSLVLHVNGAFHTAYRLGTVEQLVKRRPRTRVATLEVIPVADLLRIRPQRSAGRADYVLYAAQRARGLRSGTHAVYTKSELRYRLHVPETASPTSRVPLLVWLTEDGLTARDGLDYWRVALGAEAAIAVIGPPHRQVEENLRTGGRWFWNPTFSRDVGVAADGIREVIRYVSEYAPVDPERVLIAGAGAGGTVAAMASVYDPALQRVACVLPQRYRKVGEQALPAPDRSTTRTLTVLTAKDEATDWWQRELAQYGSIGIDGAVHQVGGDLTAYRRLETRFRESLLPAARRSPRASKAVLLIESDSPLARHWARVVARRRGDVAAIATRTEVTSVLRDLPPATEVVPLSFVPQTVAGAKLAAPLDPTKLDPAGLPLHPNPFGGTTLVVVPKGTPKAVRDSWRALAKSRPVRRRNRFSRMELAFEDEGRGLFDALVEIQLKKRRNVLVVPGEFCAGARRMRALRDQTGSLSDDMDLAWQPGVGAAVR